MMTKGSFVVAIVVAWGFFAVCLMSEPGLGAVDCKKLKAELAPCGPYLMGSATEPSPSCCKGVQYIKDNTAKADREATCQCIKDTANELPNLKDSAAQELPNKCDVTIDVPISKTVDCTKI